MVLRPVTHVFVNSVCTIHITQKCVLRIAVFPLAARETAHNNAIKIMRRMVLERNIDYNIKLHRLETLTTGWTVRGSNPGGGEIFRTRLDRPWGPPSLLYNGYQVFPGGKANEAWC
jgi:hypothetical protein